MSLLPLNTELGRLEIIEVYEYYDQPCLFSCKNEKGAIFLAIWSTDEMWLYVPVTEERINEGIQIRDYYFNSEKGYVYLVRNKVTGNKVEKINCNELIDDWLPIEGEYL